jgi:LysM repeat protein
MVGKSARLLAPIALAAVTLGVYLIVHSALGRHAASTATPTSAIVQAHRRAVGTPSHTPAFYVVKSGDTLSQISVKAGIPITRLISLNPGLAASPNSLQTGQRLRLRH